MVLFAYALTLLISPMAGVILGGILGTISLLIIDIFYPPNPGNKIVTARRQAIVAYANGGLSSVASVFLGYIIFRVLGVHFSSAPIWGLVVVCTFLNLRQIGLAPSEERKSYEIGFCATNTVCLIGAALGYS